MSAMGAIQGGWEFVWGAYGVTGTVLVLYALSIHLRYRDERRRAERAGRGTPGGAS